MEMTLKRSSGKSVDRFFVDLRERLTVPRETMLLAGESVRSHIVQDTAHGVDAEGSTFAPYSKKGPYYYNPSTGGGKFRARAPHVAAARLHGLLKRRGLPGALSRNGTTIRFESYAEFKATFGRLNVDLRGIDAPHMLDQIEVQATANEARIFIQGEAGGRAQGHNVGAGRLPRRTFFAISQDAAQSVLATIRDWILKRN